MISRTTKIQLLVFVLITVLGMSFVGARYAGLDRLVVDDSYTVAADFAESGGIFVGAEVTYRGVPVGRVSKLHLSPSGVFVDLAIDNDVDEIPSDVIAVVADRSAVGEQYVDLQPQTQSGPYLADASKISRADTRTPISATSLLVDLDELVNSVDKRDLQTVVSELGQAFYGAGDDLSTIIDTGNAFVETASDNLDVTTSLIKNTKVALQAQLDSESSIQSFTRNLRLFSDTLASSDPDLRAVIDNGATAAADVRQLILDNSDDLSVLINNLVTTGEITSARVKGIQQILVLYPYVVAGGYTVIAKDPLTGLYDAHFGLVLTQDPPVCHAGYDTQQRDPNDLSEVPINASARCTEPPSQSSSRGAQNAPAYNRSPVVAKYDPETGTLTPASGNPDRDVHLDGGQTQLFGEDSWKWLLLGPLARSTR